MASATAMAQHIAILLLLVSPLAMRASSAASACAGEKLPPGRTYATCEDLPQLGAALHWTYDKATSSLSLAFVAVPSGPSGWVAWGLNPTGEGMSGTQALVALKSSSSAPAVKTYNITGYAPLAGASTPIAFPATDLAADSGSGGKIRLYGKLKLIKGMKAVNQVWQVGSSVSGGAPSKHSFAAGNLAAKATLVLAGKATVSTSTAPNAVSRGPSSSSGSDGHGHGDDDAATTTTPSTGKSASSAPTAGVSAVALIAAFTLRAVVPPPRVRFIPISLSFWLNVSAVACFCYGMFTKDPYFKYPNEAGFFFSCVDQIGYLYFWYREPSNAAVTPTQGATHNHVIELSAQSTTILDAEANEQQQTAEVIEITAVM